MKRVLVMLIAGTILSGVAAIYVAGQRVEAQETPTIATR